MIEDALWKILAFILAVILIFLAPMMTMLDRQEAITYSVVFSATAELTDITRDIGRLDEKNLSSFMHTLSATGNTYDVTLEHYKKVYVPVYDSSDTFTGEYYTSYEGIFDGDIEAVFESAATYDMSQGDLFYVHVENRSKTLGQAVRNMVWGQSSEYPVIIVRNGGMVRHEPN